MTILSSAGRFPDCVMLLVGRKSYEQDNSVGAEAIKSKNGLFQGLKFCFEFTPNHSVRERRALSSLINDNGGQLCHGINKQVLPTHQ